MDDRTLLELAARAADIDLVWSSDPGWAPKIKNNRMVSWNPLGDDGDALRLAVKLEINILPTMEEASARNPSHTGWINEDAARDPYAATRRAIVRAAAEIGRAALARYGSGQPAASPEPVPDIPVGCEMTRNWSVTVCAEGTDILTLSSEYVAGVADLEPWYSTIRGCAQHLLSFVGDAAPVEQEPENAASAEPVLGRINWPTMPSRKGQSPVLFDDGYAEGWAKCMSECRKAVAAQAPAFSVSARGVGTVDGIPAALAVYFDAVPNSDDIRALHEIVTGAPVAAQAQPVSMGRLLDAAHAAVEADRQRRGEPVAWVSKTIAYSKYISDARYRKLRPAAQRWYEPYKCASCAAPVAAQAQQPVSGADELRAEVSRLQKMFEAADKGMHNECVRGDRLESALRGMLQLDEENHQRHPGDEDVCKEVRDARAALSAHGRHANLAAQMQPSGNSGELADPAATQVQTDHDEDAYVIASMGRLLAEIAVIVRGAEQPLHRHGYADLPARVAALKAESVAAQAQPVAFARDGVLFWYGEHAAWRGFSGDLYLSARLTAQPQTNMPPLTDAMRAVLRNEHDVYGDEDALYAALCDAAQAQKWEGVDDPFFSPENMTGLDKDELIRQLQWALNYWMPSIAGDGTPDGERCANDSYLLYGMKTPVGREGDNTPSYWEKQQPSAQDREDAERMEWICDHATTKGGGAGMDVTFRVPDSEDIRDAIDAARAAKEE